VPRKTGLQARTRRKKRRLTLTLIMGSSSD
jgi:hypothetical protein